MDDVDLGDALPPRDETTDSSGSHSHSDDDGDVSHDDNERLAPSEGLSQRLRGSLQRRVTPLVGNLRHSIATSTGVDATTSRLRSAMQRIRSRDDNRVDGHNNQADANRADDTDDDDNHVFHKSASATLLRSSLSTAGLSLIHKNKLILLGHTPLVQPQDDVLYLERPTETDTTATWTMTRGDFVRIQCPDDRTQSWLCQIASDKSSADADVLELTAPFPGPLLPDAVVHYVPRECLPSQLTLPVDEPLPANDEDHVTELRSSLDGWRPSMDDVDGSTDDEAVSAGYSSVTSRSSVARDKAAAFYETLKTRKARLRTSSADYKDKLKAASQVSKEKLAVASQISREKLAVASQASKEKLASVVSKEKLAAASQVSKEKLAVASQVSKEKLAVASQASKEKMAVAGQASKLKMQSWTSSAKSSFKAKMAQRAEQKAAAAGTAATTVDSSTDSSTTALDVFTIDDDDDDDDDNQNKKMLRPERGVADVHTEEEQLRRELDDC